MKRRRILPTVDHGGVLEVILHRDSFVLIARAVSGSPDRYHAIRVYYDGRARCVGCELPLRDARECASRAPEEDGRPLARAKDWLRG